MKLNELILDYRRRMGISQREFARRSGLSHGTISILEKGYNAQTGNDNAPDMVTYKKVADGMGITLDKLFDQIDQREMVSIGSGMSDSDRLEALHQNPKLELLFDRSRKMSEQDIDFMLQLANKILGENYGE